MVEQRADIVVAGHICLDVLPVFAEHAGPLNMLLIPGKLINVGPAIIATGGAVSNTGLALHRLGVPTRLMGKVGTDLFGNAILDLLREHDETLARSMIVGEGESTSYTIVINPPGVDRIFFHCPGANDSFTADNVDMTYIAGAQIFHFGYPPLMRRMYLDQGTELATLMQRVKANGITTSLDMAYPDPDSEAGRIDWVEILTRVLPYVDLFLPSFDELLFMLDRPRFDALSDRDKREGVIDGVLLRALAEQLLDMGVAMVVLKLGDQGLYLRTTSNAKRLAAINVQALQHTTGWLGRELLSPCFKAQIAGTTGAGDCTIAGFLAGLLKGLDVEDVMTSAVAVGAFSVESPDATSGVPDWDTMQRRVRAGWARHDITLSLHDWRWDASTSIWIGPHDQVS
jgi:sugar/nucleoside kinase (ribokinase family)